MSQPAEMEDLPAGLAPPRHGYQGNRGDVPTERMAPLGLSIAVSREAGARGGTIARLVGEKLSWQVYDQELLEYVAQNPVIRQGTIEGLSPACLAWVEGRLTELEEVAALKEASEVRNLAHVTLALAAQGQIVLIGRGAGCILPRETTLNVRVIAPKPDRIAYMSQWLRLPTPEAAEHVRQRDDRRAEFLARHFRRPASDVHQYDLILNSTQLGEDGCAELIARAALLRSARTLEQS